MKRTMLGIAILAVFAFAASWADNYRLTFNNALTHTVNATAACTTDAILMEHLPYVSVWANIYQSAKSSDSGIVEVSYQISNFSTHFPKAWTVIDTLRCGTNDTLRTIAARVGAEFYPIVGRYLRLRIKGITGNAAATVVDSVYLTGFHDN